MIYLNNLFEINFIDYHFHEQGFVKLSRSVFLEGGLGFGSSVGFKGSLDFICQEMSFLGNIIVWAWPAFTGIDNKASTVIEAVENGSNLEENGLDQILESKYQVVDSLADISEFTAEADRGQDGPAAMAAVHWSE